MKKSDNNHEYEIYEGEERLVEEVSRCGVAKFAMGTRHAFGEQRGSIPNSFELYFVETGLLCMWVDGQHIEVAPRNVLIVQPNQKVVGSGPDFAVDPCHVIWMVLHSTDRTHKTDEPLTGFAEHLFQIDLNSFPVSEDTIHSCERIVDEHRKRDAYSVATVRSLAVLVISGVLRDFESVVGADVEQRKGIPARVLEFVNELDAESNYNLSLDEMAQRCGLSRARFCQAFAKATRSTPVDHLTHLCIRKARQLLIETNASVTDIAMELGFSSSQYFATVFKKHSAFTPSAYRRSMRKSSGPSI